MTNREMDAIEIQDAIVGEKRASSPRLKLLRERLVETTHRTGTRGHSHQCLSHFSHLLSTHSCYKHLRQTLCHLRFIAAVAFKRLGMELSFSISRNVKVFDGTRRSRQIPRVGPIAVAFPLRGTLSPTGSQ